MLMDIKGHVLLLKFETLEKLRVAMVSTDYMPFAVSIEEDGMYQLSHPMSVEERISYRWLYDLIESREKVAKSDDTDDNTPPDLLA